MQPNQNPTPPARTGGPDRAWPHRRLYENVIKTLYALPEEFRTSLRISDFRATDIFTLNSALGASIEDAVVNGLNSLREVWDPDVRAAQKELVDAQINAEDAQEKSAIARRKLTEPKNPEQSQ